MHMGYHDQRRHPDFAFISKDNNFTQVIDCVIISHFHLDHCGSLPYFTEVLGYDGPIFMTFPTKAICPILLEDFRRILISTSPTGEQLFTSEHIKNCMKKVTPMNLHQTIILDNQLEIRAFYAGHVLGAAIFYVKDLESGKSVVYTGDYNMTPDRHLGAANIEKLKPDLFITETTYATTIRDPKSSRERDFLKAVHQAVERGGKVLIPVFALGRVQELCILLESYWERMNLKYPIYFSAGLVQKANYYYQLFVNWTNQKIKNTFVKRNMFDFNHIQSFDRSLMEAPGPMVLFATPGMLHAGMSLEVFKKWGNNEKNLVVLPGYCVEGTVGNKLINMSKTNNKIEIDNRGTIMEVKCEVRQISFSAHADAKGILHLIQQCEPKNVMLVHGEKGKMNFFKQKVERDLKLPCFDPPNGTSIVIPQTDTVPIYATISSEILEQDGQQQEDLIYVTKTNPMESASIVSKKQLLYDYGIPKHKLKMTQVRTVPVVMDEDYFLILLGKLTQQYPQIQQKDQMREMSWNTIQIREEESKLIITWSIEDDTMGEQILCKVDAILNTFVSQKR